MESKGLDYMIKEKIKKKGGEVLTRNWIKGRFLGKGGFAK
jgi:hypothetical protein